MAPATVPAPSAYSSMAFDRATGLCWLHSAGLLWTWDGSDWTLVGAAPAGSGSWLFEDRAHGQLVNFVGLSGGFALVGGSWVPVAGRFAVGAFDMGRGAVVGTDGSGTFESGDPAAATIRPIGVGCLGSYGVPLLHGEQPPRLGELLLLRLENVLPASVSLGLLGSDVGSYAGLSLPIDLTPLGMIGCQLATAIEASALVFGSNWAIPVPSGAVALLGVGIRVQTVVMDPLANAAGAVASNAVLVRVGN